MSIEDLPDTEDTDGVSAPDNVRKLQEALPDAVRRARLPIDVGLSLGYACIDASESADLDSSLRLADPLYAVKSARRVQVAARTGQTYQPRNPW